VGSLKSAVTKRINAHRGTPAAAVWQRNYYERVIRDEEELDRTREYVVANPAHWAYDRENPYAATR
jgi:REP element-mobilizing transposase RayT